MNGRRAALDEKLMASGREAFADGRAMRALMKRHGLPFPKLPSR
jgi:hypothetical protein